MEELKSYIQELIPFRLRYRRWRWNPEKDCAQFRYFHLKHKKGVIPPWSIVGFQRRMKLGKFTKSIEHWLEYYFLSGYLVDDQNKLSRFVAQYLSALIDRLIPWPVLEPKQEEEILRLDSFRIALPELKNEAITRWLELLEQDRDSPVEKNLELLFDSPELVRYLDDIATGLNISQRNRVITLIMADCFPRIKAGERLVPEIVREIVLQLDAKKIDFGKAKSILSFAFDDKRTKQ